MPTVGAPLHACNGEGVQAGWHATWVGAAGKQKGGVTPQPALSCNVRDSVCSGAKSYQDFSIVMNKIVGARLYQI